MIHPETGKEDPITSLVKQALKCMLYGGNNCKGGPCNKMQAPPPF